MLLNWVLEKTLESSLDCKEIQPVYAKGDQSWRDWCWSWNSNTLATWCGELAHLKGPWCWERLRAGGEGDDRGWDGCMASPTQWTWVWVNSRSWWWTGRPGVLWFMGSQTVGYDWVTELNWTECLINATVLKGQFSTKYFKTIIKGWILRLYYWKKGLEKGSIKFILKEKFQETVVMVREI